jgi:hypothetical protein
MKMSPAEIKAALKALAADAGPKAYASVDISAETVAVVSACLYPNGITNSSAVRVEATGFAEAVEKLTRAWEARRDLNDKHTIRKMALSIIEVTTDQGECSDAALRGCGFSQRQIDAMGDAACSEATRLATGGPFSIVPTTGANAKAA